MAGKASLLRFCARFTPEVYRPPAGVLFPYAHVISDSAPLHIKHLYKVPHVLKFQQDVDSFCRRFRPLQLSELPRTIYLHGNKTPARYFLLSFDDGMREVYDVIAPLLRAKGVPAIFFLNSAAIDNKRLLWKHKVSLLIERSYQLPARIPSQLGVKSGDEIRNKLGQMRAADEPILDDMAKCLEIDFEEYLRTAKPYLTTAQILELARAGFEFGAHSDTHPHFHHISFEDQKEEIRKSVTFIRALGLPCRAFAFPFNDDGIAAPIFDYMRELDLVLSFGTSEARLDPVVFSFQRFALDAGNGRSSVDDVLRQLSLKSFLRQLSGTELMSRR